MTEDQAKATMVEDWLKKADASLATARVILDAGQIEFAVSRAYYACFYMVTALLLKEGKKFTKHFSVLAELNRSYVKTGRVDVKWGKFHRGLLDARQKAEYTTGTVGGAGDVRALLAKADEFVEIMRGLVTSG